MDRKIGFLTIPDEGGEALRSLLDLGKEGVVAFYQALQKTGPILVSPLRRAEALQPQVGDRASTQELVDILLWAVYPLYDLRYEQEISAEELHTLISSAIADADDWPEEYTKKWNELKGEIIDLLKVEAVGIEAKGRELLRDRANRVHELRIFSDVRPLFNDARDTIQANVLTNTLCIKYMEGSGGRHRTVYFSLDPDDLNELKKQIEKAEKKNTLIIEQQQKKTLMFSQENGEHPVKQ